MHVFTSFSIKAEKAPFVCVRVYMCMCVHGYKNKYKINLKKK